MAENEKLSKKERREKKKQKKLEAQKQAERQELLQRLGKYAVVAAVLGLIGWWIYNSMVPIPAGEAEKPLDTVQENAWVKGNPEGSVVLIEYSDFQCPACKSYVDVVDQMTQIYGDELAVVYRHFPLKQIHLQAELAAQAAEAAGKQGMFWEMHDVLFANQDDWAEHRNAEDLFVDYAEGLGLDVEQFRTDLNSKEVRGFVKADFQSGLKNQINSTPTFYLQGERIDNPRSEAQFAQLIEQALPATGSADQSGEATESAIPVE